MSITNREFSKQKKELGKVLWRGKTRGGVLGYSIFIFVLKHFDIKYAYLLLRFVSLYFVIFAPRAAKSSYSFYKTRLNFTSLKAILLIYKNFYTLGQIIVDKFALLAGFNSKFSYSFEEEYILNNMIAEKKGGLLISAHIGNWEIAGQLLNRLDTKFKIVMFDAEYEKIKKQTNNTLIKKDFDVILIKNDMSHIFQIKQALDRKEIVCIHGDRFLKGNRTVSCNFFGSLAKFPYGVFIMASLFEVPVSFVTAVKLNNLHYNLLASPFKYYYVEQQKDRTKMLNEMIFSYVQNLESILKKYPEQWFNYYDFWSQE